MRVVSGTLELCSAESFCSCGNANLEREKCSRCALGDKGRPLEAAAEILKESHHHSHILGEKELELLGACDHKFPSPPPLLPFCTSPAPPCSGPSTPAMSSAPHPQQGASPHPSLVDEVLADCHGPAFLGPSKQGNSMKYAAAFGRSHFPSSSLHTH